MKTLYVAVLSIALSVCTCVPAAADPPQVDLKALADRGAKTLAELRTTPGMWTVRNTLGSGAVIEVSVLRAGGKQRAVVTLERGGQRSEMVRIIARDGSWYTTDHTGSFRYRPYEMPAETPFVYICMGRAAPQFVVPGSGILAEKLEASDGRAVTFRQPLEDAEARQLQGLVDQMDALTRESGKSLSPEVQAQMDAVKDLLAHGTPVRVDATTGQIVEFGTQKLRTQVSEFRFLKSVDEREFAVDGQKWQDYSDDPTAGNLDDLAMIGHQPGIQPGAKNYDLDGRLIDLKTGRFRRLPFPGGLVMPGCFLRDRRSVLVTGMEVDSPALRPYRLNLKTLECQPVGGPLLDSGFTLGGDLSPDGKTAVFLHMSPAKNLLQVQICLIDLATGRAQPLGKPMDTAFVNWAADGQHLVLLDRKHKDLNSPDITSLAVMDMHGVVTVLRSGDAPVVLADRKTILYQDVATQLWHTCDLNGQNDNLYGDGLKRYGFPSPAPDGKRILMMHFTPGGLPSPVVLKLGASEGQLVTNTPGLWGMPAWR